MTPFQPKRYSPLLALSALYQPFACIFNFVLHKMLIINYMSKKFCFVFACSLIFTVLSSWQLSFAFNFPTAPNSSVNIQSMQTNNSNSTVNYNHMQQILRYQKYNMQKFLLTLPQKQREQFEEQLQNSEQKLQDLQQQVR
jgi:hypothetical protein